MTDYAADNYKESNVNYSGATVYAHLRSKACDAMLKNSLARRKIVQPNGRPLEDIQRRHRDGWSPTVISAISNTGLRKDTSPPSCLPHKVSCMTRWLRSRTTAGGFWCLRLRIWRTHLSIRLLADRTQPLAQPSLIRRFWHSCLFSFNLHIAGRLQP